MKDQVVGICNVGGGVPHIKYRTVEWLRLVLKPHIPRKGEVISPPFLDTTCLIRNLLETDGKSGC